MIFSFNVSCFEMVKNLPSALVVGAFVVVVVIIVVVVNIVVVVSVVVVVIVVVVGLVVVVVVEGDGGSGLVTFEHGCCTCTITHWPYA